MPPPPLLDRMDRPYELNAVESRSISNQHVVSQLTSQNEYLQRRIRELESQLESSITAEAASRRQAADAAFEKVTLSESLRDVDRMAERLKLDREAVVEVADRELGEAKVELSKTRGELERQDMELAQLRSEVSRLTQDNAELSNSLTSQTNDLSQCEALVDKLQDDKRKQAARVNKLINTEKELVGEIDRLKRNKGSVKAVAKRGRSPNRFDQFIKSVEQERDYWKGEVETLQQVLRYRKIGESTRSCSPGRPQSRNRNRSASPIKQSVRESRLEATLRTTEEERDYFKREFELQKSLRTRPSRQLSSSDKPTTGNTELHRVIRERDELQTLLDKFERHMAEIQANVKVLTAERDRLADLFEQAKEETQRVRHELLRQTPSKAPSLATQHILKRIEEERDDAHADARRLIVERDSLRERLKVSTDTHIADKARLEQMVEDLSDRLKIVQTDKNQLEAQASSMRQHISKLDEDIRLQMTRCQDINNQCEQHKNNISKMRLLADEREKTVQDSQKRLLNREEEFQSLSTRYKTLEEQLSSADRQFCDLRNEVDQLRSSMAVVTNEKQSVIITLSEKTDRCQRLELEIRNQQERTACVESKNRDLQSQLDNLADTLRKRDKDAAHLKKKFDQVSLQLDEVSHSKKTQTRENRALENDLAAITEENYRLSDDIQDLLEERKQLAAQVQDYVGEIRRVEDVLAKKEEERARLVEQYRSLTVEAERLDQSNNKLESERSALRNDVSSKDGQIRRFQDKINLLEKECHQNNLAQQALEGQLNKHEKTISSLEDKLRHMEKEKYSMKQNVNEMKVFSADLETDREALRRHVASKEAELEKAHVAMSEMDREIGVLKDRCHSDRQRLASLEQVLSSNRDKEFQNQLALQESASEVQLMRDRLTLNESKIDSQNREIGQLKNKITGLEADLERSRRQVTNEKFEKERIAQEVRRLSDRSGSITPFGSRSGHATPNQSATSPNKPGLSPTANGSQRTSTGSSLASAPLNSDEVKTTNGLDNTSLADWIKETERKVKSVTSGSSTTTLTVGSYSISLPADPTSPSPNPSPTSR